MIRILKEIIAFSGKKKKLFTKAMIVSFIGAVFGALQFLALMMTLDIIVGGKEAHILPVFAVMLISMLGRQACFYYATNAETETGYFMAAEKRVHIGDRLRYIPMGFFNDNSLGNITAVVTTTLSDVENNASRCLVIVIGGFLNTLAFCLALFVIDVRLGVIAIIGILVYLAVTECSTAATAKTGPGRQQAQEGLVKSVLEYVQGMSVVKSYGLEKDNDQAAARAVDDSCKKALALTRSVTPWIGIRQVTAKVFGAALAVASLVFYYSGSLDLSRCILMLIASFMVYQELENAGNMSDNLQMLGESMRKANSIDDTPTMDTDGSEIRPEDASVEFKNVSFSYGDRKILDGVSIQIPAGSTTAVVGPSGGGKTTLCNLIARFWDVDSGEITLSGTNVKDYSMNSLMNNFSFVFQNVYLFADTIENNIKFGRPEATHEEVVEAAKKACCHDFISKLPDGYNTVIGEGGATLSGGEKQRISIARAIMKDSPIIILDEATANVDPENEKELTLAVDALTKEKTIIMIAHRLKTVRHADQIVVVDQGRIAQKGTHEELMKQDGIYRRFVDSRELAVSWKI